MATRYPELFSPISIGKVQLKNRIVKTAAQTYFFESGERRFGGIAKAFYGAVARGGAGLIIVETPAMESPYKETATAASASTTTSTSRTSRSSRPRSTSTAAPSSCSSTTAAPGAASTRSIAARVAASAVTVPVAVRRPRGGAAARADHRRDRGVRRARSWPARLARPAAASTASRSTPRADHLLPHLPVPLLEQARRQVRSAEHGEPDPLRRRGHQGDQEARRPGLPRADAHERHRGRRRRRGPQPRGGQGAGPLLRGGRRRFAPRDAPTGWACTRARTTRRSSSIPSRTSP